MFYFAFFGNNVENNVNNHNVITCRLRVPVFSRARANTSKLCGQRNCKNKTLNITTTISHLGSVFCGLTDWLWLRTSDNDAYNGLETSDTTDKQNGHSTSWTHLDHRYVFIYIFTETFSCDFYPLSVHLLYTSFSPFAFACYSQRFDDIST